MFANFEYVFTNINVQVRYYKDLLLSRSTHFLPCLTGSMDVCICIDN